MMKRHYELKDWEDNTYRIDLPDGTDEVAGIVLSGDEILIYPIFYDPQEENRCEDHFEGYFHKVFIDGKWEDKR